MTTATVHYHGGGEQRQEFTALPRPGDFLERDDRLYRVADVVFSDAGGTWAPARIDVYALPVGSERAAELTAAWATWDSGIDNGGPVNPVDTPPYAGPFLTSKSERFRLTIRYATLFTYSPFKVTEKNFFFRRIIPASSKRPTWARK